MAVVKKHKPIVVEINSLANACGCFNGQTSVNNYYGCDHPEQEETELVKVKKKFNGDEEHIRYADGELERKILWAAMRKKYGSYAEILKASKTVGGRAYYQKVLNELMYDNKFVSQFGCKIQGKCYSFSCPLAGQCDLQDLKKHDTSLYNQWKDEEYDPTDSGADLMLITDKKLIERLA